MGLFSNILNAVGIGSNPQQGAAQNQMDANNALAKQMMAYLMPMMKNVSALSTGNISGLSPDMQTAYNQNLNTAQQGIRQAQASRGVFASGPAAAQEANLMPNIRSNMNTNLMQQMLMAMNPYMNIYGAARGGSANAIPLMGQGFQQNAQQGSNFLQNAGSLAGFIGSMGLGMPNIPGIMPSGSSGF